MLLFLKHATDILMVECVDVQEVTLKQFHIKINVQKASGCKGGKIIFQYRRLWGKTRLKLLRRCK